jgi:hypothetical protein
MPGAPGADSCGCMVAHALGVPFMTVHGIPFITAPLGVPQAREGWGGTVRCEGGLRGCQQVAGGAVHDGPRHTLHHGARRAAGRVAWGALPLTLLSSWPPTGCAPTGPPTRPPARSPIHPPPVWLPPLAPRPADVARGRAQRALLGGHAHARRGRGLCLQPGHGAAAQALRTAARAAGQRALVRADAEARRQQLAARATAPGRAARREPVPPRTPRTRAGWARRGAVAYLRTTTSAGRPATPAPAPLHTPSPGPHRPHRAALRAPPPRAPRRRGVRRLRARRRRGCVVWVSARVWHLPDKRGLPRPRARV